jgi:hypothetical protein
MRLWRNLLRLNLASRRCHVALDINNNLTPRRSGFAYRRQKQTLRVILVTAFRPNDEKAVPRSHWLSRDLRKIVCNRVKIVAKSASVRLKSGALSLVSDLMPCSADGATKPAQQGLAANHWAHRSTGANQHRASGKNWLHYDRHTALTRSLQLSQSVPHGDLSQSYQCRVVMNKMIKRNMANKNAMSGQRVPAITATIADGSQPKPTPSRKPYSTMQ